MLTGQPSRCVIALVAVLAAPRLGAQDWVQKSPAGSPPARAYAAMAYDAVHQQVVLFGGSADNVRLNDTWVWDGTTWTQRTPANSPSARNLAAMAYDAARQQIVLFGGSTALGYVNDTWVWDGTNWTQRSPAAHPPAQAFHSLSYDEARQRVVLTGGQADFGQGSVASDTWLWDGVNWAAANAPSNPPETLTYAATAYDKARQQTVRYSMPLSSYNPVTQKYAAQTWVWDGVTWAQKAPAVTPDARILDAPLIYEPVTAKVLLFGGYDSATSLPRDDTWMWDGAQWTLLAPAHRPAARAGQAMAYDEARQQLVLFGGAYIYSSTKTYYSDTWVFIPAAMTLDWHLEAPATRPPKVDANTGFAYDGRRQRGVLYQPVYHSNTASYSFETWLWDGLAKTWTNANPAHSPNYTGTALMAYDERRQEVVFFGESNGSGPSRQTWVWNGVDWTQRVPLSGDPNVPLESYPYAMAYDAARQLTVLFTGKATWVWDGADWTLKAPQSSPIVYPPALSYDAARQQIVLSGQRMTLANTLVGTTLDTWTWDGVNWSPQGLAATLATGSYFGFSFDALTRQVLLYGGTLLNNGGPGYAVSNKTYAWDGGVWSQLSPPTTPPAQTGVPMIYDPIQRQVVMVGGAAGNDTWTYGPLLTPGVTGVTVTVPGGVQFTLNNVLYTGSQTVNLAPGVYTISVASPQFVAPSTLYTFNSWSDGGGQSHAITVGSTPLSLTADFAQAAKYPLTTTAVPSAGGTQNISYGLYDPGTQVQLTATPNAGYAFAGWSGACSGTGPCTVTMDGPKSALANYSGITVVVPAGVQFTFNGVTYTGTQTIAAAPGAYTLATVSPQPAGTGTQLRFTGWSDGGAISHTVVLGLNATSVSATFQTQYLLTLSVSPPQGGLIGALGGPYYDAGAVVQVTTIGNQGYTFAGWSGACGGSGSCSVTMSGPRSVIATYNATTYALTIKVPASVQYSLFGLPLTGTQTIALPPGQYPLSLVSPQPLGNGAQLVFQSWSDGGAASHTITMGAAPLTLTGLFKTQYLVTASSAQPSQGSAGFAGGPYFDPGTKVVIVAVANPGYVFEYWSGGCSGSAPFCTVTVNAPVSAVAHFSPPMVDVQFWREQAPTFSSPEPRIGFTLTYDESRQETLLFGGFSLASGKLLNDVWIWNGTNWQQQQPVDRPSPRSYPSAAYHAGTRTVVLVGGITSITTNGSNQPTVSSETWAWDGRLKNWVKKADFGGGSIMAPAFCGFGNNAVLFGGLFPYHERNGAVDQGKSFNDTWVWDGNAWSQRQPVHRPPARYGAAAAFDTARNEMVVAGGYDLENGPFTFHDTWAFNGTDWYQYSPATPLTDAALGGAYDSSIQQFIYLSPSGYFWSWDGQDWTKREVAPLAGLMAYDTARQEMVMFGTDYSVTPTSLTYIRLAPRPSLILNGAPVVSKNQAAGTYDISVPVKNNGNVPVTDLSPIYVNLTPPNVNIPALAGGTTLGRGQSTNLVVSVPQSMGSGKRLFTLGGAYSVQGYVVAARWSFTTTITLP